MSKLKLKLNESDLFTLRVMLLASIEANPVEYLRENPLDYLVVADLTSIYHRVASKLQDLRFFGSTRNSTGKIVSFTLTRPEAISLYIMLSGELLEVDVGDNGPSSSLTYETTLVHQLVGLIHRTYFI